MLISIRNKATGWIAWVIVGIIALTFALFGINTYFEGVSQVNVASVEGDKISLQSFQRSMEIQRRNLRQQFGANFDPALVDNPAFRSQVLESLVTERLMRQYVQDQGLRLDDATLAKQISENPSFQQDGAFSRDQYRRVLSSNGFTPEGYEQSQRIDGALQQLRDGISSTGFVSQQELDQYIALSQQSREADYVLVKAGDYEGEVEVSDDDIQAHYDANPDAYQEPERAKVDYLELDPEALSADFDVSDEEALAAYESTQAQYLTPEVRKASHILFTVSRDADEQADAEVKARAESVLADINAGADFAELATEHSEDPGSRENGGDLGLVSRGQMVESFEEAVFSMQENEVRGPVKTQFGYHLIKLTTLTPESQKPFEEVKSQVISAEQRRLADAQFGETAEQFRTLVFEHPESLVEVAEEMGLEIKTSDWMRRNQVSSLLPIPGAANLVFSDELLEQSLNSEVIEGDKGKLYAMRKNDYEPASLKSLESVREAVKSELVKKRSAEKAKTAGEAVKAQLEAGEALEEGLAATQKTLPATQAQITDPVEREIARAVFTAEKPAAGAQTVGGTALNNGDYVVYTVKSVTPADPAEVDEATRERLQQLLLQREGFNTYAALRALLRAAADVDVFSSVIEDEDIVR